MTHYRKLVTRHSSLPGCFSPTRTMNGHSSPSSPSPPVDRAQEIDEVSAASGFASPDAISVSYIQRSASLTIPSDPLHSANYFLLLNPILYVWCLSYIWLHNLPAPDSCKISDRLLHPSCRFGKCTVQLTAEWVESQWRSFVKQARKHPSRPEEPERIGGDTRPWRSAERSCWERRPARDG